MNYIGAWSVLALTGFSLFFVLVYRRCCAVSHVDWEHPWLNCLDSVNRWLCKHYHRMEYEPLKLPPTGPAIVVANHISGLDPMLLVAAANRPLRFMIAKEEYERFGLTWMFKAAGCIPVDRKLRPERALRVAQQALARGEVVALFPHGSIQGPKKSSSKIKGGAVRLAQMQDCSIYPVFIDGIKGHGFTLLALLLRSRARLKQLPVFKCGDKSYEECQEVLAQLLNAPLKGV